MIYHKIKIHDTNSLELKYWFHIDDKIKKSHFEVNMWFISPSSIDVTGESLARSQFYLNIKSNYRLITPVYSLSEIVLPDNSPLYFTQSAVDKLVDSVNKDTISSFEYYVKMYTSIFKSAIRDRSGADSEWRDSIVDEVREVVNSFRELKVKLIDITENEEYSAEINEIFRNGDEYITFLVNRWAFEMNNFHSKVLEFITEQNEYKKRVGFQLVSQTDMVANSELLYKLGMLKKQNSNQLYFGVSTKKDGVIAEQVYYSIAAGLAMFFATLVAFTAQIKYGNLTMPLFVALIVSYMLKDRIKDVMRYYFAHKRRKRYFDTKSEIMHCNKKVGVGRQAFDFISNDNVPYFIKQSINLKGYHVSLYRKYVEIDNKKIDSESEYKIIGMNNIVRRNIADYLKNMDNSMEKLYYLTDDNDVKMFETQRVYYFYIVIETKEKGSVDYSKYSVKASRDGIISLTKID